jgi:serine protease inhibitor
METTLLTSTSPRWWRLVLWGFLFEVFLLVLCPCLPSLGSFFPRLAGLLLCLQAAIFMIHIPLLLVLSSFVHFDNVLAWSVTIFYLLSCLLLMAFIWAFIFRWLLRFKNWLFARVVVSARQKKIAKSLVVLVVVVFIADAAVSVLLERPRPFKLYSEVKPLVDANTAFAVDLYQKLADRPGNLFFSPFSISSVLAMTYAGARGPTEAEMAKVLHFDSPTNVEPGFSALTDRIHGLQRWNRITLLVANSLWYERNYSFTSSFFDSIQQDYHADARPVDFINAPDAAQNGINSWIERKTNGKIQDLAGAGQFTPLTRLVLCDAVYFKGKWQTQFNPNDTKPAPFYVSSNQTVTVPMMSLRSHFKIAHSTDGLIELLEMPYVGDDLSMIILLPNAEPEWGNSDDFHQPTFSDLEKHFTAANLCSWLGQLDQKSPEKTDVLVPRFTTTQSFDLLNQLKSLGMVSAFDELTANFSGMDGTTNLYVSDILHKAYIEVNESGTEAAAATIGIVMARSMPERFIADHPFIFLIRDNGSGAILFLGRIIDPTK